MYLIVSVFITDVRWPHSVDIWGPPRYDRLDIFKETLKSYSGIVFDKILLFVKLDVNYSHRWSELQSHCTEIFGNDIILEPKRLERQDEWIPIVSQIPENKLVWFCQCDDHVFIDFDKEVLNEGLELMRKDASPKKALVYSHWPELIRDAGVFGDAQRVGDSYIRITRNYKDPLYIWSQPVMKEIFIENKWPESLWKRGMVDALPFEISKMAVYVPLRELCRHFDGYAHVKMSEIDFPRLTLPLQELKYTEDYLRARFRTPHIGAWHWLMANIPKEWEDRMIELYRPNISAD